MKCPKCGSNKMEWSPVANGIAVCRNCWYQGVPDLRLQTNFELFVQSPVVLAEGMVCNRNGMWEFVWHNIAIIRKETREAAVAVATADLQDMQPYSPWGQMRGRIAATPERKANAALIAAAPEMYEGLKEIRDVMEKDGRFCRTVEAIDKLLKKARGEA